MVGYAQILQRLPQEWRMTMLELAEAMEQRMREQLAVRREDFIALSAAVRELADAQARTEAELREYRARTEERFARIEAALERLTEAQARTEVAIQELRDAQARTEAELREYRAQTEERFARIEAALERLTEAQARTEVAIQELRDAQARTEVAIQELRDAQARTEVAIQELRDAQARTEVAIQELRDAQARTEQTLQNLIVAQQKFEERLQRLETRVGRIEGRLLEMVYRERVTGYFGKILRRPRAVDLSAILDNLEARLSPAEVEEILNLDLLVTGQPRPPQGMPVQPAIWLAVEISATVEVEDITRAVRRAALLRKAGYPAIPAAAGQELTVVARTLAQEEAVLILQDGRVLLWEEAFARLSDTRRDDSSPSD